MRDYSTIYFLIAIHVVIFCHQKVNGLNFGAPETNCYSDQQCEYGICRKVTNQWCSAGSKCHLLALYLLALTLISIRLCESKTLIERMI